jgi:hypothetical protein
VNALLTALLAVHLSCAAGATGTFWSAAFSRKGGAWHRAVGRWFARLVYVTALTGGVLALLRLAVPSWFPSPSDPRATALERQTMWLVLYVLVIIVAPVQHGVAVARATRTPARVRSIVHAALAIASMIGSLALLPAALLWQQFLFLVVVPIGLVVGLRNLSYAARRSAARRDWEAEHLTSQLTAGVTLHTALFVFGTSRTLALNLTGSAALLPWVLPAVVGLPVISWMRAVRSAGVSNRKS